MSFANLNEAIQSISSVGSTQAEIVAFVRQLSVEAPGSTTVLYAGRVENNQAWQIVESMGSDVRHIGKTMAAQVLNSDEFKAKVAQAFGLPADVDAFDALADDHPAKVWLNKGGTGGPWATASEMFVDATNGPVRILTLGPAADSVLFNNELPKLLEKLKSGTSITSVDGLSRADLLTVGALESTNWTDVMRKALLNNAITQTHLSKPIPGNFSTYLSLTPENLNKLYGAAGAEEIKKLLDFQSSFDLPSAASKALNKLGIIGALVGFGLASSQASAAQAAGNSAQAKEIMSLWAVDAAGSAAGEAVGASVGAAALAMAAVVGVTVTAPVAGVVLIGAALIGGIFGADGATKVYEMTKDLDENGRMDLLDRLGNLLFGVNYTVTSPLPADLNGQRLTLDATYSRENIVELAKTNIAWRYALRELNPFVITDIAYDQHNTDGSLNLYDPVTGQGAMTDAYLADRAAMLTWKIRFDRGIQDDNDAEHEGPKSYTEDWDTNAVQGNWDFVDLGTRLPGGDPLTLQIDGQGITWDAHQVVFGSNANETIEGAGDTDRLYGEAGNDTINGLDGADYIEGNTGNDRLEGGEGRDKVLGGAGDDTLIGGEGNDQILGGAGTDRYEFSGTFGEDLVIDSDGTGTVWINSVQMRGGKKIAGLSNSFISADKFWRYELGSNGDLLIRRADGSAGSVMLRGWQNGGGNRLDITLGDEPAPVTPVPTVNTYFGDQAAPLTTNTNNEPNFEPTYDWGKTTWLVDGTLDGGLVQNNFADVIKAHLIAPNTDSRIFGYGGNDALGGGDGNDEISGGDGDDLIAGGKGSNELRGGAGNDFISATGYITAGQRVRPGEIWTAPSGATVLGSGPTWGVYESASGEQTWFGISTIPSDVTVGSVIDAGDGNDQALGSWAGDTIYMGANNDVAEGLAGRDVIYGEGGHDTLFGDGIETPGTLNSTPGEQHGDDLIDGGIGNDSISGQGGSDVLLGGGDDDLLEGDGDVRAQFHGEDLLDGGQGDDELVGGGLSDQLLGGQDDDILWGDNNHASALDGARHGDDILWGEAGNDSLIGGGGKDTLLGGDNNDVLFGDDISTVRGGYVVEAKYHGADELFGGAGDDQLVGGGGADRLYGQGDNDYLYGDGQQLAASAHGDDYLDGGDGNDYLFGEGGNDTLDGGSGNNWLEGGAGDDTYIVRTAEVSSPTPEPDQPLLLNTVIKDSQGKNRVRIDASSTGFGIVQGSGSVGLTWAGAQAGTTAGIFFEDYASVGTFTLEFSDGQTLALSRLVGDTLESSVSFSSDAEYGAVVGGKNGDTLSANGSHSTLSGGQGDDQLIVNGSESTVLYDRGDGRDTVSGYGNQNVIALGTGIVPEEVFARVLASGEVALGFTGHPDDEIVLGMSMDELLSRQQWSGGFVSKLRFADGRQLALTDVFSKGIQIMADAGATSVNGTVYQDRFDGMPSGAQLLGGEGNDIYAFGAPAGTAVIDDQQGRNTVVFGAASAWEQVVLSRVDAQSNDLLLTVGDVSIRLVNALLLADRFDVQLGNGQVQTLQTMIPALGSLSVTGSEGNDVMVAGNLPSLLVGGAGDDQLFGGDSNDILDGGAGADQLSGGTGSDLMFGGDGDDTYLVDLSVGEDEIADTLGRNTLRFASGILPGALTVERLQDSTDVRFTLATGRSVTVRRALEGAFESYVFADGTVWSPAVLIDQVVSPDGTSISGDDLANTLHGTSGGDFLVGRMGNDVLYGQAGDDELMGGEGDDELIGGTGEDLLNGGAGQDSYLFGLGDGVDRLTDADGLTTVRFGAGIALSDLVATRELVEGVGHIRLAYSTDDAVLIQDGVQFGATAFTFANGKNYTAQDLFSQVMVDEGATIQGGATDDTLYGYASAETLLGGAGFDILRAGAGNDTLDGGTDGDELVGGAGVDTYVLSSTGGHDRVREQAGQASRLQLVGIDPTELMYFRLGSDLVVLHLQSPASMYISNAFTSGTEWTLVDGVGGECSLVDEARSALLQQDSAQRKTNFGIAAVAGAGPFHVLDATFSEPGVRYLDVGTRNERQLSYQLSWTYQSNDDEEVLLGAEAYSRSSSYEYLRTEETTHTYQVTDVTYLVTTETVPGRLVSLGAAPSGSYRTYGGHVFFNESTGSYYYYEPSRTMVYQTPVYSQRTVTETTYEDFYRTVVTDTYFTEEYVGGDGNNHVSLSGSAIKLVSGGGGNDLIERATEKMTDDINWGRISGASDWIDGGAGDDRVYAGLGNDEVSGGSGSDYLDAGAGSDTYFVDASDDGWDIVYDRAASTIYVEMRSSIYGHLDDELKAELRALLSDPVIESEPYPYNTPPYGPSDQQYWGYEVLAGYIPVTAATLNGLMSINHKLHENDRQWSGSDGSLYSGYGGRPSLLSEGLDALISQVTGEPFHVYDLDEDGATVFRPAIEFQDSDLVSPAVDTVRFGAGVVATALAVAWSEVDTDDGRKQTLSISWGGTGGIHVVMPDGAGGQGVGVGVEQFEFSDGTVWSMQEMLNHAPARPAFGASIVPGDAMLPVEVLEDSSLSFQIPLSAFVVQGGSILGFELRRAGSSEALPSWIQFDAQTGTLSGVPVNEDVGALKLEVTAILSDTKRATQALTLQVANTNDAPEMGGDIAPVAVTAGEVLSWSPMDDEQVWFSDVDQGDRLSFDVKMADASELPSWLSFNPLTGRLEGQPDSTAVGSLQLRFIVRDLAGAEAELGFSLQVNDAATQILYGSSSDDTLSAGGLASSLYGREGNDTLTGSAQNDILFGESGDDQLDGATGNDTLEGGVGSDTYYFRRGDGQDVITDDVRFIPNPGAPSGFVPNANEPEYQDRIKFGEAIAADQLWFRQDGSSLEISIIGTNDKIEINGWYDSPFNEIEEFELADGQLLLNENVNTLVQAMAAFSPPAAGQTTLAPNYAADLAPVIAASWQ